MTAGIYKMNDKGIKHLHHGCLSHSSTDHRTNTDKTETARDKFFFESMTRSTISQPRWLALDSLLLLLFLVKSVRRERVYEFMDRFIFVLQWNRIFAPVVRYGSTLLCLLLQIDIQL